jgi:D-threo-aldose 1-dehydrogenase
LTVRRVLLGETGVQPTVLGFGCAELFREPSRAGRLTLLEAAYDAGVRYFDVAPMYGLGLVEREVGAFAHGRRDDLVLATKFGISPTRVARRLAPAQAHLQRMSAARRSDGDPRSGTVGRLLYRTSEYGPETARRSLERSLHALQTDRIDLFFLHDPPEGAAVSDDVRSYLDSAQTAGLIRAWGVAGQSATRYPDVAVIQARWDPFSPPPAARAQPTIRFGAIGRPLRRILGCLQRDPDRVRHWSDALGVDCSRPETIAGLLLRDALDLVPASPLLFGSTRTAHIRAAVAATGAEVGAEVLAAFRRLLAGTAPTMERSG